VRDGVAEKNLTLSKAGGRSGPPIIRGLALFGSPLKTTDFTDYTDWL